jgi:hypothetical protein
MMLRTKFPVLDETMDGSAGGGGGGDGGLNIDMAAAVDEIGAGLGLGTEKGEGEDKLGGSATPSDEPKPKPAAAPTDGGAEARQRAEAAAKAKGDLDAAKKLLADKKLDFAGKKDEEILALAKENTPAPKAMPKAWKKEVEAQWAKLDPAAQDYIMASPNSTFTELVSTTFRKHRKEIKDNVSKNNALLRRIYDKGNYRKEDGGLTIVCPLDYAQNGTYQRYSDWDVLNIGASDVISAAEYQWRQIAMNVVSSGRDLRINSGDSRIINLAKARLKNAIRTFKNNFSADVYSDGTLTNQINGLQALVSDAGTGTVGGINSATFTFWQNKVQSAAAPIQGGGAITCRRPRWKSLMLPLWLSWTRGDDKPDLIVADNDYFTFYEQPDVAQALHQAAVARQRAASSLKYKSAT